MINTEFWKPVVGYEDCYLVSDQGRIKRIKPTYNGVSILKPNVNKHNKICRVTLHNKKLIKRMKVHSIVLEAFVGPLPNNMEVNHKDGSRLNNSLYNIEYITHYDNVQHAKLSGFIKSKEDSPRAILTLNQVREIRFRYIIEKTSYRLLGIEYGVAKSTIKAVIKNTSWKE